MTMLAWRRRDVAFLSVAVLCGTAGADADISDDVFVVTASSSLGTGSLTINAEDGVYDDKTGTFVWDADQEYELVDPDNNNVVATLADGNVTVVADPVIGLNFIVVAGAADTDFTIKSPLLSSIGLVDPEGTASAGLTLTDSDGDGAMVSGDSIYQADFNGEVPNGTNFATLLDAFGAGSFDTATASDDFPGGAGNFAGIPGLVDDMSSQWSFSLTANDQLGGTSVYVVIPSPAGAALLGLAGFGAMRRRR